MALLALGFTGPEKTLSDQLGLETDVCELIIRQQIIKLMYHTFHRWRYEKRSVLDCLGNL
jgi:hypothetical protein